VIWLHLSGFSIQQFQIQNQLSAFQPLRPHPPTPSPNSERRGAGAKSLVSYSLSQTWERAGVRAGQCRTPTEFLNLELLFSIGFRNSIAKKGINAINIAPHIILFLTISTGLFLLTPTILVLLVFSILILPVLLHSFLCRNGTIILSTSLSN
jgi:hypothetical protein